MNQNDELSPIVHSADYSLGFEDGYQVCEDELEPVIEDLLKEIDDLKRQIYAAGGTVE